MDPSNCLSDDILKALLVGKLNDEEAREYESHLMECAACGERTRNVRATDTVLELLPRVKDVRWTADDEAEARQLAARLSDRSQLLAMTTSMEATFVTSNSDRPVESGCYASPALPGAEGVTASSFSPGEATAITAHPTSSSTGSELTAHTMVLTPVEGAMIGAYRLESKVGEGGMGAVWKALHTKLKKYVALKVLPAHLLWDSKLVSRFEREMEAVGRLDHPAIVRAMDAGEVQGTHYLVMEYVDGQDLGQLVKSRGARKVPEACEMIRQAAVGLAYAHKNGLIHRDIKPSNLFLTKDGKLKILDLGLARLQGDNLAADPGMGLTGTGQVLGTPDYMAPEQWENTHTVGPACDLYALGCTLFFVLTGRAPFGDDRHQTLPKKMMGHVHEPPPELSAVRGTLMARAKKPSGSAGGEASSPPHDIPPEVEAVYQRLMSKEPSERFASAEQLAAALLAIVKGKKPVAPSDASLDLATGPAPADAAPQAPTVRAEKPQSATPSASRPAGRPTPPARKKWLAWGSLGAVLLGVIVITIRYKDGSTGKIVVPKGADFSIGEEDDPASSGPATPAMTQPADDADPHRAAARAVLDAGGTISVLTAKGDVRISKRADLLAEPFILRSVNVSSLPGPLSEVCTRVGRLPALESFLAYESHLTDADLLQLGEVDLCEFCVGSDAVTDKSAGVIGRWKRLLGVQLPYTAAGDETCRELAQLPSMWYLNLGQTPVSDKGLAELGECPQLSELLLGGCKAITARGLSHLRQIDRLRKLNLDYAPVGDEVVDVLAEVKQLRMISLHGTRVSAEGARRLQLALPNAFIDHPATRANPEEQAITRWALEQTPSDIRDAVTGAAITRDQADPLPIETLLFSDQSPPGSEAIRLSSARGLKVLNWPNLKSGDSAADGLAQLSSLINLNLTRSDITGVGLSKLAPLSALRQLWLSNNPGLDDKAIAQLPELSGVSLIDLSNCPITGAALRFLKQTPNVQIVMLSSTRVDAGGVEHLASLPRLRTLYLANTETDDTAIPFLGRCAGLRFLELTATKITPEGMARLRAALPQCSIRWDGGLVVATSRPVVVAGSWHGWPVDAPKPAIAPFDAAQAKRRQEEWAAYLKVPVEYTNSLGMKFRLIPPGEFLMGSTAAEVDARLKEFDYKPWEECIRSESPQHKVILTRPIYLGLAEVTQAEYQRVMGKNPSRFAKGGPDEETAKRFADINPTDYPVESVSWNDAAEFCARLSQREKLKPFYSRSDEIVSPLEGTGYRLPTEAEWEFSCRAGTTTKYWIGDKDEDLRKAGWFDTNSGGRTYAVRELMANPFGLFDVHGNVFEWVQDGWEPTYYGEFQEKPALDPNLSFSFTPRRVLRGGAWYFNSFACRSSLRLAYNAPQRVDHLGFRVSLPVDAVKAAIVDRQTKPANVTTDWHGWPVDAPKPAIAPFDAAQAKRHQEEWAKYLNVPVEHTNSIGMKFRLIPPREFVMGSTPAEIEEILKKAEQPEWREVIPTEAPQHKVVLTRPVYAGIHEVTQSEFERVIGSNPSFFAATGKGKEFVQGLDTSNHPVEMVNWDEIAVFCQKLSEQERISPAYSRATGTDTRIEGDGYRLPTEAEWEFLCRAGTTTRYWTGDSVEEALASGWFLQYSKNRTHPVGEMKSNPFGLYDVHGNVFELVEDYWDGKVYSRFADRPAVDPEVAVSSTSDRSDRSGAWNFDIRASRSAQRGHFPRSMRESALGFRAILSVDAVRRAQKVEGPAIPKATSISNSPVDYAAERKAAEWVIANKGAIVLAGDDGIEFEPKDNHLPETPFAVSFQFQFMGRTSQFVARHRTHDSRVRSGDATHESLCGKNSISPVTTS